MICPTCGGSYPDHAPYCGSCGRPNPALQPSHAASPPRTVWPETPASDAPPATPTPITAVDRRVASEAGPVPESPDDALELGAGWPLHDKPWACCLVALSPFILYALVMLLLYISGFRG
jgi:hypothetical protein